MFSLVLALLLSTPGHAQSVSGPVTIDYSGSASYTSKQGVFTGNVTLNAPEFGANADKVIVDFGPKSSGANNPAIARASMTPVPGQQVSGHYTDVAQGRSYAFTADRAVYASDATRKGGGNITLTGHVIVSINAPVALDGPFLSRSDKAVILLGPSPGYPQIQTGPGHITFTPLKGGA